MSRSRPGSDERAAWRERTQQIIFEADTPSGKAFDVALFAVIVGSILCVMLESVPSVSQTWRSELRALEWIATLLFTAEYALRLVSVRQPTAYARSFFGVVDLLAILPSYLSLLLPGSQSLIVIRALRLLRIFRVFKLARYLGGANLLLDALRASAAKVIVFLTTLLILVTIIGAIMYLVEGEGSGFTSIPVSIYWAIVTMTTVGYGDLTPQTVLGQILSAIAMIAGYSIIAVPTGIVSAEIVHATRPTTRVCPACLTEGHEAAARFCKNCGIELAVQPGSAAP